MGEIGWRTELHREKYLEKFTNLSSCHCSAENHALSSTYEILIKYFICEILIKETATRLD